MSNFWFIWRILRPVPYTEHFVRHGITLQETQYDATWLSHRPTDKTEDIFRLGQFRYDHATVTEWLWKWMFQLLLLAASIGNNNGITCVLVVLVFVVVLVNRAKMSPGVVSCPKIKCYNRFVILITCLISTSILNSRCFYYSSLKIFRRCHYECWLYVSIKSCF